jgi:hypothetical protein
MSGLKTFIFTARSSNHRTSTSIFFLSTDYVLVCSLEPKTARTLPTHLLMFDGGSSLECLQLIGCFIML